MFHWWHRVRDGTLAHATFARYMWPVRPTWSGCWKRARHVGCQDGGHLPGALEAPAALWTFCVTKGWTHEQHAERAIRPGVLWRKRSFGTRAQRLPFVEAMMTVVATLKQQHRNVLDYVTAACEAALCGTCSVPTSNTGCLNQVMRPPRSLVPQVNAYKSVSYPGRRCAVDARRELYHPFCNFVREVYARRCCQY